MNTVFMGSPEFAEPIVRAIAAEYPLAGIVTQPDRPAGRGRKLRPPAVKLLAQALGLAYIQPRRLAEPEAMAQIRAWAPDLIVVAAFGQILRRDVLELPKFGCLNIHASLLPRWRGASPVQAAIAHGDLETGVTVMRMDAGLDTGPIIAQRSTSIGPTETGGQLAERLSLLGAELLIESLPEYVAGRMVPVPQNEISATYARILRKDDGELDFSRPAPELANLVRAYDPWPATFFAWRGRRVAVFQAHAETEGDGAPGLVVQRGALPAVAASSGLLVLDRVQPAGKAMMKGDDFVRGAQGFIGSTLESPRRVASDSKRKS